MPAGAGPGGPLVLIVGIHSACVEADGTSDAEGDGVSRTSPLMLGPRVARAANR